MSEQHPWKAGHKEVHERAILGTANILRKVLMLKYKMFIMGSNITCTIYCNHGIVVTLYTLESCFVPGI
jgi:hypothetical protein